MKADHYHAKELLEMLGYKSVRSLKDWCTKNNVLLFQQGKLLVASKIKVDQALERIRVAACRTVAGKKWLELFIEQFGYNPAKKEAEPPSISTTNRFLSDWHGFSESELENISNKLFKDLL